MKHLSLRLIVCGTIITLMLTACASASPASQPLTPTLDPSRLVIESEAIARVDALLSQMAEGGTFTGSVLVAEKGEVLLSQGYGYADREQKIPNTPQTRFRLASVTKQFTAMAILILQNQGKLDVQDPICNYIADCPAAWKGITIHHLLTHTSGITVMPRDYNSIKATHFTPEQLIGHFKDSPLDFQPGEKWSYSNCGYMLLGYIIEQVSGQSYEAVTQQSIFTPLNLSDSGYIHNSSDLAVGYANQYSATPAEFIDSSISYAAGALYSTVEDLYRWDQALYTERLLPQTQLDQMFAPQAIMHPGDPAGAAYGYGWFVMNDQSRLLVYHEGVISGFKTAIARYPDDQITIIVLCNQEDLVDTLYLIKWMLMDETVTILADGGYTITFAGPLQAQAGGTLQADLFVTDPSGHAASGVLLSATLGDPPTDPRATHTSGALGPNGTFYLSLPVDWPAGTTRLYCEFRNKVYKVTEMTINP